MTGKKEPTVVYYEGAHSYSHNHNHRHNVSVIEKRAPTDESVRLLREMENSALNNVVAKVAVENNVFNAVAFVVNRNPYSREYDVLIRFKLNGQVFDIKTSVREGWDPEDIRKKIGEEAANAIFSELLAKGFTEGTVHVEGT